MPLIKSDAIPSGNLVGEDHGASVSLIFDESEPGHGPRLAAGPGDVVIVPADTPHGFTNHGPGPSKLVCIHANPTFETEWLES